MLREAGQVAGDSAGEMESLREQLRVATTLLEDTKETLRQADVAREEAASGAHEAAASAAEVQVLKAELAQHAISAAAAVEAQQLLGGETSKKERELQEKDIQLQDTLSLLERERQATTSYLEAIENLR